MIKAYDAIKAKEQIIKLFENRLMALNKEFDEIAFTCRNTKKQLENIKDRDSEEYKTVAWQMLQADLDYKCLNELFSRTLDAFNNCISRKEYDYGCCGKYACSYEVNDEDYY